MDFKRDLHVSYLKKLLSISPSSFRNLDGQRTTILYLIVSGLDLLNEIDTIPKDQKDAIIEWIYSLQITEKNCVGGFQLSKNACNTKSYELGHIVGTYAALCTLIILGDSLERVNRQSIINSLRCLQLSDGCYMAAKDATESDMRFLYCAACISYFLNDWSGIHIDKAVKYILESISYDHGIGQGPDLESHCGSTFCAISSLSLFKKMSALTDHQIRGLKQWLMNRLTAIGFSGRPNKAEDTCYSFWAGGALKILDTYDLIHNNNNKSLVLITQSSHGGFAKWVNTVPDPLHTYLGLGGLSFMGQCGIADVVPELNISIKAHKHILQLHEYWSQ